MGKGFIKCQYNELGECWVAFGRELGEFWDVVKTTTHIKPLMVLTPSNSRGLEEYEPKVASFGVGGEPMRKHERWQQKKRFILRMWAKGFKGMPKRGWIRWRWYE